MNAPDDTHPAVRARQLALLREAGAERRAALARSMSATVIELSRRELAARMPGASTQEVGLRWVELHCGPDPATRLAAHLRRRER